MFFTRFYYSLSLDDGRIRLGIKRNWIETENWLEKRSTPFFPPAPVTSPPKRKCPDIPVLPSHSLPPDLSYWEKVQVSSLIFYFRFFTYYIHPFTMAAKSKLYKTYSQMIDCDRRSDYGGDFYPKTTLQAFI